MKRALLIALLLTGCATTSARTSGPREIAGWPDWRCLEFPGAGEMSFWYLKTQAPEEGRVFKGTCDSWAQKASVPEHPPIPIHPPEGHRTLPPPKPIDPKLLRPFHAVSSWPGWVCADYKDGRAESVWRTTSKAGPPDSVYPGRCEDWGQENGGIRSSSHAASFKILGGKGRATLLLDNATAEAAVTLLELDPGAEVAEHDHEGSAEILFLEQGSVEMKIAGRQKSARAGDVIHIPAGVKHSAKVAGDVRVKAVQIYTPPGPEQRFRKGERIR